MSRLFVIFLAVVPSLIACTKEKIVYVEVPVEVPASPQPVVPPAQTPPDPPPVLSQWERERLASMKEDGELLMEFYRLTEGDGWREKDNWGSSDWDLTTWYGVSYSQHSYRAFDKRGWGVYGLYLPMNWLKGQLPDFIWKFRGLKFLNLRANHLSGPIPRQLSWMKHLEQVNLMDNQLTGSIPDLSESRFLNDLSLWDNQLSGPLPAWLGENRSIGRLWLGKNQFSGSLETSMLPQNIINLTLDNNQLSGALPVDLLDKRPDLAVLRLHNNQFTGSIPDQWAKSIIRNPNGTLTGGGSFLKELTLSGNKLTGCIPSGLFALRKHDLDQIDLPTCK